MPIRSKLGENRIAQPKCRGDGRVESGHGGLGNQIPVEEGLHYGTHALMHHQLGDDQQWESPPGI
jgi:hypothetical protein